MRKRIQSGDEDEERGDVGVEVVGVDVDDGGSHPRPNPMMKRTRCCPSPSSSHKLTHQKPIPTFQNLKFMLKNLNFDFFFFFASFFFSSLFSLFWFLKEI